MTDHIPAGITPEDAKKAREWALHALNKPGASTTAEKAVARVVIGTVPEPRPTLADMTPEEREECRWMQADVENRSVHYVIATPYDEDSDTALVSADGEIGWVSPERVTPRPDLPRWEWPGDKKPAPDPAPALPDGWRLADHEDHGRVIVTNPTPDPVDDVYFVFPYDDDIFSRGYGWHFCDPSALTYIDQEADTTTGPDHLAVGTVIESADDPRIAALPDGSVLSDCDGETIAKRAEAWVGIGYIPIASERDEFGPWTVRRIGWEADQ